MKIWAKLMKGDKILRDVVYEDGYVLRPEKFIAALQEISCELDVATPVSLPSHFRHLEKFNRVKYLPRDFVEEVDFDAMILERVVPSTKFDNFYI